MILCALILSRYTHIGAHNYLSYSQVASCLSIETTITCTGSGNLTQAAVRSAGAYNMYTKAIIKNNITIIGRSAFSMCTNLVDVTLPSKLLSLEIAAFERCSFESIIIPSTVTNIASTAMNACVPFKNFISSGTMTNYVIQDGFVLNKANDTLLICPTGKGSGENEELVLPSVTTIADACRWSQAQNITIPDTVTTVKSTAFYSSSVVHLKVGKNVATFDMGALSSCSSLQSIELDSGNNKLFMSNGVFGSGTVSSPTSIIWIFEGPTTFSVGSACTGVAPTALQDCSTLTSITITGNSKYQSIHNNQIVCDYQTHSTYGKEWRIYAAVGGVTEIDLSDSSYKSYKWIREGAFRSCQHLTSIKLNSNVNKVGGNIARDCPSLISFSYNGCYSGNGVYPGDAQKGQNVIQSYCFSSCYNLATIVWPGGNFKTDQRAITNIGVTHLDDLPTNFIEIGDNTFNDCAALVSVTIRKNMVSIGSGAFENCPRLAKVTFEDPTNANLGFVGSVAFGNCKALTSIEIPDKNLTSESSLSPNAFVYSGLVSITFNTNAMSLFRSDGTSVYKRSDSNNYYKLMIVPPGISTITLNDETRVIGSHAFYGCNKLTNVIMNDKVTTIEESAFFECNMLTYIRLSATIHTIGTRAFDSCAKLKEILFCSNNDNITYDGDPFPTDPKVYLFYDFPRGSSECNFCGHQCYPILDHYCNIPTQSFTISSRSSYLFGRKHWSIMFYVSTCQISISLRA